MSDQVTITFSGMCAFQVKDKRGVAVMLSEGGEHRPALALPTDFVDGSLTTWKPDHLVDMEVPDGTTTKFVQLGIWKLQALTLTASDDAPAPIPWTGKDLMIDFKVYHPDASTKSLDEIRRNDPSACIFTFDGGALAPRRTSNATISQEHHPDVDRSVVAKLQWKANIGQIANNQGGVIVFSGSTEGWISNLAPVSADQGATHVKHYYEMLDLPANSDKLTRVADKDTTVFDCIRPSSMP